MKEDKCKRKTMATDSMTPEVFILIYKSIEAESKISEFAMVWGPEEWI